MKLSPERPRVLETRTYPSTTFFTCSVQSRATGPVIRAYLTPHQGEPLPDGGAAQLPAEGRGHRDRGGVRAARACALRAGRRRGDVAGHGRAAPAPAHVPVVPRRAARRPGGAGSGRGTRAGRARGGRSR